LKQHGGEQTPACSIKERLTNIKRSEKEYCNKECTQDSGETLLQDSILHFTSAAENVTD